MKSKTFAHCALMLGASLTCLSSQTNAQSLMEDICPPDRLDQTLSRPTELVRLAAAAYEDDQVDSSEPFESISELKLAAEGGDAYAAYMYGRMLSTGRFVEKDRQAGLVNLEYAATRGIVAAQVLVATIHRELYGEMSDTIEGARHLNKVEYWARSAIRAEPRNSSLSLAAQYQLGLALISEDYQSLVGLHFLINAANSGHTLSRRALVFMQKRTQELVESGEILDDRFVNELEPYDGGQRHTSK